MIFKESDRKIVRECNLEWHCHTVSITQPNLTDGYCLEGYGIIKTEANGGLYLDFICLESNKKIDFQKPIPEDALDDSQCVEMNATSIDGIEFSSKGLRIEPNFQNMLKKGPKLYRLGLEKIVICDEGNSRPSSYLHLEFSEKCNVPFNKTNTTESSLGSSSFSRNQAVIECDGFEINIIQHKKFTEVYANGTGEELSNLRDAIFFYLGFTSGVFIQPYYEYLTSPNLTRTTVNSVDLKKVNARIPAPVSSLVIDEKKGSLDRYHHELLQNIFRVSIQNPNYLESVYSQWSRIWHSFLSPEISVSMLTVSVAVEGVLNDIFIPTIDGLTRDEGFEEEKDQLKKIISSLNGMPSEHIKSIQGYIDRWGNMHAKKALQYLLKMKIIEKWQIKGWENLRNSSAHPKLSKQDEARRRKNIERTIVCLGLFYRIALNVFSYKGAQYTSKKPKDNELVVYEYVNLLY